MNQYQSFPALFDTYKEVSLHGRYISPNMVFPLIEKWKEQYEVRILGYSVQKRPVYTVTIGNGPTKVLGWSQMHGNEGTTTKALFDFMQFLSSGEKEATALLSHCTFCFLPMLNPDGAHAYTRENANNVDLNRDMQLLSQPESKLLREIHASFRPDYCLNLHDQRTIFGAGDSGLPATVSFLAPSFDESRSMNPSRLKAVAVIMKMNKALQYFIPGQVGRFDDAFNLNCAGDTFQFLGTPTILIEAGHYQNDYEREETRKFIFFALLSAFHNIYENDIVEMGLRDYMHIPQNKQIFFDFVYKNININYDNREIITTFAAQFTEKLIDDNIAFCAFIVKIDNLDGFYAHQLIDGKGGKFYSGKAFPEEGQEANFRIGDLEVVNGMVIGHN